MPRRAASSDNGIGCPISAIRFSNWMARDTAGASGARRAGSAEDGSGSCDAIRGSDDGPIWTADISVGPSAAAAAGAVWSLHRTAKPRRTPCARRPATPRNLSYEPRHEPSGQRDQIDGKPRTWRKRFFTCTPSRNGSARGTSSLLMWTWLKLGPSHALVRRANASTASSAWISSACRMPQLRAMSAKQAPKLLWLGLHAGLAIVAIVQHHDAQVSVPSAPPPVARPPSPISCSPSPVITITGRVGWRDRQAERQHRRAAHRTPKVEIAVAVPGGENVVAGRAQTGDDQRLGAGPEQRATKARRPMLAADPSALRLAWLICSPTSCVRSGAATAAPSPADRLRRQRPAPHRPGLRPRRACRRVAR